MAILWACVQARTLVEKMWKMLDCLVYAGLNDWRNVEIYFVFCV
jgi:hypothetical protein